MKKLLFIFSAIIIGFSSCRGPQGFDGPPGPQGAPGADGGLVYASAIELIVDFTPANDFTIVEGFGFDVFPADVPLVYILWDQLDDGTEVWRPVPQNAYLDNGILTYNYDFTQDDFSLFLDGTVPDFSTLDPVYLNEQVFRVVVVPSEFLETARLKSKSYESIVETFGIKEEDFIKRDLR
ncbi:hypothetical protein [Jiulongibacter sediminis]|uniref:Dihydrolipoamide dehydrogenase n=1 Tax=Jiulongibacter sediminis TaxID=1605367 RepID=A0A0P7C9K9_9BACT|nr:hypothetical protein [Jiulongibacter sediminis]KPM49190.1 hypothetical protein AFM12_00650 [Jiulongibacter sediminis]TBX26244.1 hypothetical protein TK44_00650 [Jiulongibacter sediminis]